MIDDADLGNDDADKETSLGGIFDATVVLKVLNVVVAKLQSSRPAMVSGDASHCVCCPKLTSRVHSSLLDILFVVVAIVMLTGACLTASSALVTSGAERRWSAPYRSPMTNKGIAALDSLVLMAGAQTCCWRAGVYSEVQYIAAVDFWRLNFPTCL